MREAESRWPSKIPLRYTRLPAAMGFCDIIKVPDGEVLQVGRPHHVNPWKAEFSAAGCRRDVREGVYEFLPGRRR